MARNPFMMVHRVIKKSAARPSLPITSQVLVEVRMDREPLPHSDLQGPPRTARGLQLPHMLASLRFHQALGGNCSVDTRLEPRGAANN